MDKPLILNCNKYIPAFNSDMSVVDSTSTSFILTPVHV